MMLARAEVLGGVVELGMPKMAVTPDPDNPHGELW